MNCSWIKLVTLAITFILLLECGPPLADKQGSYTDTSLLQEYLKNNDHKGIPNDAHLFIVVPRFGCYGCMQRTIKRVQKEDRQTLLQRTTFIVSNSNPDVLAALPEHVNCLRDSFAMIDQLDLQLSGVRFILTFQGEVVANEGVELEHLDKVSEIFARLKEVEE